MIRHAILAAALLMLAPVLAQEPAGLRQIQMAAERERALLATAAPAASGSEIAQTRSGAFTVPAAAGRCEASGMRPRARRRGQVLLDIDDRIAAARHLSDHTIGGRHGSCVSGRPRNGHAGLQGAIGCQGVRKTQIQPGRRAFHHRTEQREVEFVGYRY